MLHLRDSNAPGQEVRIAPKSKRESVRYEWHVPTLCGKLVVYNNALDGDGILYNVCPVCLSAR